MRVVLDANIFISAFVRGGKPNDLIERVVKKSDTLFITDEILTEVERVLGRPKFDFAAKEVEHKMAVVKLFGHKITVSPKHRVTGVCRDPKDDMYLSCAVAAGADYIVTGDKDLLVLGEYGGVRIIKPADYLETVAGG